MQKLNTFFRNPCQHFSFVAFCRFLFNKVLIFQHPQDLGHFTTRKTELFTNCAWSHGLELA